MTHLDFDVSSQSVHVDKAHTHSRVSVCLCPSYMSAHRTVAFVHLDGCSCSIRVGGHYNTQSRGIITHTHMTYYSRHTPGEHHAMHATHNLTDRFLHSVCRCKRSDSHATRIASIVRSSHSLTVCKYVRKHVCMYVWVSLCSNSLAVSCLGQRVNERVSEQKRERGESSAHTHRTRSSFIRQAFNSQSIRRSTHCIPSLPSPPLPST